jgi:AraC family transcriptional regulator, ethanolamine operon transcriptional activator
MTISHANAPIFKCDKAEPTRARFVSLRTTDFDQIAGGFPGWKQRNIQIGGGSFQGRVVLAQFGRFQLFEAEGNRAILSRGDSPPNSYAFSPVQERNAGSLWRGRTLRPGMINIRRPGEPMDHRTSENYRTTGLIVDADFVHRVAGSLHGVDGESVLQEPVVTMEARRCISLDRSLQLALARLASSDHAKASLPQIQELLIEWLSRLLGNLIPDRWRDSPSLGSQRKAQVVREAENYMLAYLNQPMTLLEICEAIGVSERTLTYAFNDRTGVSPKAYLKALKLNRLREDLKVADPLTDSVHHLARHWGLDHSGALASDYKILFGELPSQTLGHRRR